MKPPSFLSSCLCLLFVLTLMGCNLTVKTPEPPTPTPPETATPSPSQTWTPAPTLPKAIAPSSTARFIPTKTPPATSVPQDVVNMDYDETQTSETIVPSQTQESTAQIRQDGQSDTLIIEEYLLEGAPQLEPLRFQPKQGTQAEILQKHLKEREKVIQQQFWADWGNDFIFAAETLTDTVQGPRSSVNVFLGEQKIYNLQLGVSSPINALQGFITYDNHWLLETAYVKTNEANQLYGIGQVILDGELLNTRYGYEEAFSLQSIRGKPFYFFNRKGQLGISYDFKEIQLGYSNIPHYQCCSGAVLNPIRAENMTAFFAQKDEEWYYVEIGF